MSCKAYLLTGVLLTAATFAPAGGPAAPVAPSSDTPRVSSPYWNQGSDHAAQGDQSQSGQNDLPAADIRAVPPAMAQATQARWVFRQSYDDLSYALRVNQMQYDLRPDVVNAVNAQRAAYSDLQKERARVLAPLNDNAAYTASNKLSANVTEQIADERDSDAPNPVHLLGMATVRLNYVQDNRKLEASLLDRDDTYQKARQRYIDAGQKVADLRQTEALAVMTDADLTTLRHQVASARIAKLTSAAYLSSVIDARDIALNYAGYYRNTGYLNNGLGGGYLYGNNFRY